MQEQMIFVSCGISWGDFSARHPATDHRCGLSTNEVCDETSWGGGLVTKASQFTATTPTRNVYVDIKSLSSELSLCSTLLKPKVFCSLATLYEGASTRDCLHHVTKFECYSRPGAASTWKWQCYWPWKCCFGKWSFSSMRIRTVCSLPKVNWSFTSATFWLNSDRSYPPRI